MSRYFAVTCDVVLPLVLRILQARLPGAAARSLGGHHGAALERAGGGTGVRTARSLPGLRGRPVPGGAAGLAAAGHHAQLHLPSHQHRQERGGREGEATQGGSEGRTIAGVCGGCGAPGEVGGCQLFILTARYLSWRR